MLPPMLGAVVLALASICPASTTAPVPSPLPEPIPTVADARAYALAQIGPIQYACLDTLWSRESGWDPTALNPDGAYGIPQALPGDRMAAVAGDWRVDPVTQVRWGLSYIAGRYGSSCAALAHENRVGWY